MAFAAAVAADAGDDEAVAGDAEVVFTGDGIAECGELFAREFDELVAHLAVEVVVLRVAVIVLVHSPVAERHLPQEAGFDELIEGTIDCGPANFFAVVAGRVGVDQFVGVEMVMPLEDEIDQCTALLGGAFATALQVFLKPFSRRERDLNFAEREVLRHGRVEGRRFWVEGRNDRRRATAPKRLQHESEPPQKQSAACLLRRVAPVRIVTTYCRNRHYGREARRLLILSERMWGGNKRLRAAGAWTATVRGLRAEMIRRRVPDKNGDITRSAAVFAGALGARLGLDPSRPATQRCLAPVSERLAYG